MEYNANEKPQKITNQLGKITQFTYDTKNNLKSMTDEAGNITNFVSSILSTPRLGQFN